jgi:hypothetical protein
MENSGGKFSFMIRTGAHIPQSFLLLDFLVLRFLWFNLTLGERGSRNRVHKRRKKKVCSR